MSRKLTTEEYHRMRGAQKQKHLDRMANGQKKPSRKAREWFRRPAYSVGFASGGDDERRTNNAD